MVRSAASSEGGSVSASQRFGDLQAGRVGEGGVQVGAPIQVVLTSAHIDSILAE